LGADPEVSIILKKRIKRNDGVNRRTTSFFTFLHFYICHFIAKLYFYFDSLYIEGRKETTIIKLKIIVISSVGFCFMLMLIFLPLSVNRIFNFFLIKKDIEIF
jgi:hypothetical protein